MKKHLINGVAPGSIGEELEIKAGDYILTIGGQEIEDVLDYEFLCREEEVDLLVETAEGEQILFEIEKDEDEDLGLSFTEGLMDEYRSCRNKCVFCFIDQMPPGMRETLYFKDDDSRLSFLQGNYITLTNMKDEDVERLIYYHLSPINISVHATNPELRCRMLHNRFAGDILAKIRRFYEAGIAMNSQVVLCKGINDGAELDRTIRELADFLPYMESLSVVPVGLTRYRENVQKLEPFDREDARKVLDQILGWQKMLRETRGTSFVHASDEWFIMAGEDFPEADYYEGYGQLENGVGMVRLLIDEVREELSAHTGDDRKRRVSIATAKLAWPTIRMLADELTALYPNVRVGVHCIKNDFFGELITVSGLMTGQDIIAQLKEEDLGEELLLPVNVLKADEDILLDDISVEALSNTLQVPVNIIQSDGKDFVRKILG